MGLEHYLEKLRNNDPTLTTLNLFCNRIEDEEVKSLAALKTNSSLTVLDLDSNNIREEGAKSLAAALKTNYSLTCLDLRCNKIGDEGAIWVTSRSWRDGSLAYFKDSRWEEIKGTSWEIRPGSLAQIGNRIFVSAREKLMFVQEDSFGQDA